MQKRWFLVGVVLLVMTLLVVSCGIPQEEHDAVVAERDSAQAELQTVKSDLATSEAKVLELTSDLEAKEAELEATNKELADIKKVYPLRDFSSATELKDWLKANDVSEQPATTVAESLYSKALEIQEDAMKDGYYVSVNLTEFGENAFGISCVAVIDGDLWFWGPESDEIVQYPYFAKVTR